MHQRCEVRVGRAMLANKHSGCSEQKRKMRQERSQSKPFALEILGKNVFTHQQNEDLVGFSGI